MLPAVLAVCAAAVLSAKAHGDCGLGYGTSRSLAAGLYVVALLLLIRLVWVAARTARATRAAVLPASAARLLPRVPLSRRSSALVLPVEQPIAHTAGIWRGQVVVSRGLLDLLEEEERRAVLAHELAHVRAGHQRMLFVGDVIGGAFGFIPTVRRAFASLVQAVELAADAEAASTVGDSRVVARAIAKAALASAPASTLALASPSHLRERLEQLAHPTPRSARASLAVGAVGALVASAVVLSVCLAIHAGPLLANVALCLAVLAMLALPSLLQAGRGSSALSPLG